MWTYRLSGGSSMAMRGLQLLQKLPQRLTAMADAVFLRLAQFGSNAVQFRHPEHRIVTETTITTCFGQNFTLPDAMTNQRHRVVGVTQQHQHTMKLRATFGVGHVAQALQQQV